MVDQVSAFQFGKESPAIGIEPPPTRAATLPSPSNRLPSGNRFRAMVGPWEGCIHGCSPRVDRRGSDTGHRSYISGIKGIAEDRRSEEHTYELQSLMRI